MGDAGGADRPRTRVSWPRPRPPHARPLLHAGAADVCARPDVLTRSGRADRLDVALTLATMIVSTAITPLTASLFTHAFLGAALASPLWFGLKLFLIIGGCALAGVAIRHVTGRPFIEAQQECIDGLSVIAMFMFAVAAMDGVADHFRVNPFLVIELTALAFGLALGLIAITALVFLRAGAARAFAIGLIVGNRNVGLMLAATGFVVPDIAWLYFAVAQFPIYLLPHLLKPMARRLQQDAKA